MLKALELLVMVVSTSNPSTWETEAKMDTRNTSLGTVKVCLQKQTCGRGIR